MIDNLIHRAEILIQQKRFDEASIVLKDILSKEPDNVHILAMLAEVKLQQDNYKEAELLINSAIGLRPDIDYLHYIKAKVSIHNENYDLAEESLKNAITINPQEGDFYALLASIKLSRKQYEEALETANKALEVDPENILGLNIRSTSLLKLKKHEESFQTIEGALAEDPNNPYTHANYGWSLLEKGDNKKALEHFREALRNDPTYSYAQAGMIEALKAKYFFYRIFLKYAFWMSNMTSKYQWGVIIGFFLGVRVLRSIASNNETVRPFLTPIIILLTLIAFSTWVITPISNLFLRLNKYGKHLLDKKEIRSSNFVGASFILFIIGVVSFLITQDDKWLAITAFGFAMMLPFSVMFSPSKYKYSLVIYTGVMFFIGLLAMLNTFSTGEIFNIFTSAFIIGFVGFQWIANFLISKESKA